MGQPQRRLTSVFSKWRASTEPTRHQIIETKKRIKRSGGAGRVHAVALQEALDVARRLTQPLLILDHGDADKALAILAITDARRDRDIGLREQLLGKFSDPICARAGGSGAHANIDALGWECPNPRGQSFPPSSRRF
jgi:hypothetical protein